MGIAIADWAYNLGYDVVVVSTIDFKRNYPILKVNSAIEMLEELSNQKFDYLIMAAAVGDFRVEDVSEYKISKENIGDCFELKLVKNPDIVKTIAKNKKENQKIIGFCLADKELINCAQNKLIDKNLDYIVANDVKTALNTDKNKVTIIEKSGRIINIDLDFKDNIAKKILEVVCD